MYEEFKKILLSLKFICDRIGLNKKVSVLTLDNLILFHHLLNLLKIFSVTRHVSGQYYSNEAQMESLEFIPFETS